MNFITVCGKISEPEMRFTKNGKAILKFGLVTDRKVGEEKVSTWHNVKAWDKLAENLAEAIHKGDRVLVTGYLEQESYTDKEGNEKKSWSLIATDAGRSLRWDA